MDKANRRLRNEIKRRTYIRNENRFFAYFENHWFRIGIGLNGLLKERRWNLVCWWRWVVVRMPLNSCALGFLLQNVARKINGRANLNKHWWGSGVYFKFWNFKNSTTRQILFMEMCILRIFFILSISIFDHLNGPPKCVRRRYALGSDPISSAWLCHLHSIHFLSA